MKEFVLTGLLPLTTSSTRATFHSAAGNPFWIDDVAFVTPALASANPFCSVLEEVAITDHQLLVTFIPSQKLYHSPKQSWKWNSADWGLLEDEVAIDLQSVGILPVEDLTIFSIFENDEVLHLPISVIRSAMTKSIPLKQTTTRSRAWYDEEVKTAHVKMKSAVAAWRKAPSEALWERTIHYTSEYCCLAQRKKQTSFRQFYASLGRDTMWSGLKRLSRHSTPEVMAFKSDDGLITAATAIAPLQARQFFLDLHRYPASANSLLANLQRESWRGQLPIIEPVQDADKITEGEVFVPLQRGRDQEAPGSDQLHNRILKRFADCLAPTITAIFQAHLIRGYFPLAFRHAQVISLPKPDKDPHSPAGYRPISLLSSLGKKLEHIINNRLKRNLEDNQFLSDVQYGFRAKRSTLDALHRLADHVSRTFNQRKQLLLLSIDLRSAFDSTDNDLVWSKLRSAQVPQYLLRVIDQFLRCRSAAITIQSTTHHADLRRGVPQGSPISPTLFAMYVNDIPNLCQGEVHCQLYADDLIIWRQLDKVGTPSIDMQRTITALETWCTTNRMSCNKKKTRMLCITRCRKVCTPSLTFYGETIPQSKSLQYLGLQLDSRFTFHAHVNALEKKMIERLMMIRKMANTHWGASPRIIHTLVRGILIPQATYAASAWGPFVLHNQSRLNQINRVLRTAALMITGAFRTSPGPEVCHLADIEQFHVLIELSLMRQATRWDSDTLSNSNSTPIQTHPSRFSTTQKLYATLPDKIAIQLSALDRPTWRSTIKDWYNERTMLEFDKLNPSSGRKELPWGPSAWYPRWIFRKFKRRDLSFLAQFLLDHWRSQVYLHRIHPPESPLCRLCQATHETREHILRCRYTQHLRQRHLPHSPHLSALSKQLKNRKTLCQLSQFLQALHQLWDPQIGT